MPLHVYQNIHLSGSIPAGWVPAQGGAIKYPVRNKVLLAYLRTLRAGRWQKVIKKGAPGEVHYRRTRIRRGRRREILPVRGGPMKEKYQLEALLSAASPDRV